MRPRIRAVRSLLWVLIGGALACGNCAGGGISTAADTNNETMAAFRYFVGTWKPVENPGAEKPKVDETYTFTPILEGQFLMSQEIYRDAAGKIVHHDFAVFGVDPDTHKLFLHAYNTDGSIDRTHEIDSPAGQWIFLGTVYGSKRFRDYRYTMTKQDENHMRVLIELLKDGKYEKLSETNYERKSNEGPADVR